MYKFVGVLFVALQFGLCQAQSPAEVMAEDLDRVIRYQMQWRIPFLATFGSLWVDDLGDVVEEVNRAGFLRPTSPDDGYYSTVTESEAGAISILPLFPEDGERDTYWQERLRAPYLNLHHHTEAGSVLVLYTRVPMSPFTRSVLLLLGAHYALVESGAIVREGISAQSPEEVEMAGYELLHKALLGIKGLRYSLFLRLHALRLALNRDGPLPHEEKLAYAREALSIIGEPYSVAETKIWDTLIELLVIFDDIERRSKTREEAREAKTAFLTELRRSASR